jgi:hypothetical protein
MASYAELHGWKIGGPVTKFWRGKYITLHRLSKSCTQCGTELTLDVSKAALDGTAKNSGIGLARCLGCRAAARLQGATSRPTALKSKNVAVPAPALQQAASDIQPAGSDMSELERQLAINKTMEQEINCFNEYVRELEDKLKARDTELAWYKKENARMRSQLPETPSTLIKGPWNT